MLNAQQVPEQASANAGSDYVQVDGRTHPELIPEYALWQAGFGFLSVATIDAEDREKVTQGLSRYALYIPIDQVRIIQAVADRVLARVEERLQPVREKRPGPDGTYRVYYRQIPAIVLAGRDELQARLPAESFKKLRRWLDKDVAPGSTFGVERSELPAGQPE